MHRIFGFVPHPNLRDVDFLGVLRGLCERNKPECFPGAEGQLQRHGFTRAADHSKTLRALRGANQKKPRLIAQPGFCVKCLAVTYFRMGKPQTIIGAERFHFRVRDGIGWFPLAIAARQTCTVHRSISLHGIRKNIQAQCYVDFGLNHTSQTVWGCMVKPHGQLVLVSFTHYCASTPSLSTS